MGEPTDTTKKATDQVGNAGGTAMKNAGGTAMKAAAAALAAGTAAVLARKAFSGDESSDRSAGENGRSSDGASKTAALGSIAAGGWDAARDALLPALEDAAGAAGTFVGENAPEVVRDRIVPRFIESFNEASGA